MLRDKTIRAEVLLREYLAEGPMPARQLQEEAERHGIGVGPLHDARQRIGVQAIKVTLGAGGAGYWLAYLPGTPRRLPRTPAAIAEEFLRATLADGPVRRSVVVAESQRRGIRFSTLRQAAERLRVRSWRVGGRHGYYLWALPRPTGALSFDERQALRRLISEERRRRLELENGHPQPAAATPRPATPTP